MFSPTAFGVTQRSGVPGGASDDLAHRFLELPWYTTNMDTKAKDQSKFAKNISYFQ